MIATSLILALFALVQIGIGRTVLATVLDQRNQPVVDLEVDDFVIRESGRTREVLFARIADYPIVVLVMPLMFANTSRAIYLTVAETFAPVAECILFWLAYGTSEEFGKRSMWQDFATIVVANLASFIGGEVLNAYRWFGLLN